MIKQRGQTNRECERMKKSKSDAPLTQLTKFPLFGIIVLVCMGITTLGYFIYKHIKGKE